ncbi:uncharacterized protein BBA_01547 [Beauveria bassiana ARSEF 2860]|uniref:Ipa protein n=1 Tax=Beauveria bassiana (strain ARSEF 2860) TaxID=655819 RepID=J4UUC7_BEAB2|nr:uncharacterized protein BBA_01547 [Beauveria bassiana ARSEF 2860]EJP69582.1 hypothetical protein BBA_01547 [Beauveria bassiana ARSEF 2860]
MLQQLANICHIEYTCARLVSHREVQDYQAQCWFVRVPNALDAKGNARIVMRHKRLTKQNILLQALLSLAHRETTLTKPEETLEVALIGISIDAFEESNAAEDQAINCLLRAAELIKNMPLTFDMPPFSRSLDFMLVTKSLTLKSIMILAKPHLDIARIMSSIVDPQLEPKVGQAVQRQCDATVEVAAACKSPTITKEDSPAQPACNSPTMTKEDSPARPASLNKKKKKPKGRSKPESDKPTEPAPKARPLLQRTALTQGVPPTQRVEPPQRKIIVSPSAAQVFATLFDRSELRGGLHWASFEAAMAELNFRITPRQGSSFHFEPPKDLALRSSLTVHRPHGPRIEGFRKLILSQRLARTFGWDAETFVAR